MDKAIIRFDNENVITIEVQDYDAFVEEVKLAKNRFFDTGGHLINLDRVSYIRKHTTAKITPKPIGL